MLIARADIDKLGIKVPKEVMAKCRSKSVEMVSTDLLGADNWIGGLCCWPHVDSGYKTEYFLTMSVYGDETHMIGDDKMRPNDACLLTPGDIFIVDPNRRHWLAPARDYSRPKPWVGLQWDIWRHVAPDRVNEILKSLGAWWLSDADQRYAGWRDD